MDMNQIQQRYQEFMANQPNQGGFGQGFNPGGIGQPGGMNPGGIGQPGGMGSPGGFGQPGGPMGPMGAYPNGIDQPGGMGQPGGIGNPSPVMSPDMQQQQRRQALAQQLMQGNYQNTMNPQSVGGQQARLGAGNVISGLAQQFAAGNRMAQNQNVGNNLFQKAYTPDTFDAEDAANMKNVGAMRTNRFAGML